MNLIGANALVTGANRGLGRQFAQSLVARGAAKVYATARHPSEIDIPGVIPLQLDVTDPASVAAAVAAAPDVNLLINNAGVSTGANLITGDLAALRTELDTHFWGTLSVTRAFAPQLAGGAILNVLSALSWITTDGAGGYHAAKAAEWALTNGARLELAAQNTQVAALHLGSADTDMMAWYDGYKTSPADIVNTALDGLEAGQVEILADDWSRTVKSWQVEDPKVIYSRVDVALAQLAAS